MIKAIFFEKDGYKQEQQFDNFSEFATYWEKEKFHLDEFYSNEENNIRLIKYWEDAGISFSKNNIKTCINIIQQLGSISQLYLLQKLK